MASLGMELAENRVEGGIADADRVLRDRALVRRWLYAVLAIMLALVLVGGATRLTDSGLSITEWEPIHGVVPPLSAAAWEEKFAKYREIPEYREINRGMSLDAFKTIYWWEWGHRVLARGVGLAFALPLLAFWLAGRIEPRLKPRLLGLLVLGGMQGAVGWWMVASGLTERTDVSQYRLAAHLTMASLIVAGIAWVARGLRDGRTHGGSALTLSAGPLAGAVLVQIYLGALVAGMDAGLAYNTWPLMDGALVPGGLLAADPWWLNGFENAKAVQFIHRTFAYTVLGFALWHAWRCWGEGGSARRWGIGLLALVLWQAVVGITTLLLAVPIGWALLHQFTALMLLAAVVWHWRGLIGPYPVEARTVA